MGDDDGDVVDNDDNDGNKLYLYSHWNALYYSIHHRAAYALSGSTLTMTRRTEMTIRCRRRGRELMILIKIDMVKFRAVITAW